jgi:cytochrome c peroxidase
MHAGQIATLDDVIEHYDRASRAKPGSSALKPLHLNAKEWAQLVAYLVTLDSPVRSSAPWLPEPR